MSRDAKIGIVVILLIVGLLVVIWGRGTDKKDEATSGAGGTDLVPPPPPMTPTPSGVPTPGDMTAVTPVPATPTAPTGTPGAVTTTPGLPPVPTIGPTGVPEVVPPGTATSIMPPEPVAPTTTEYTVKAGDSLAVIARSALGSEGRWQEIAKLNNLAAPYSLKIGQKLKLPTGAATTDAPSMSITPGTLPTGPTPAFVERAPVRTTAPTVDTDPGIIEREGPPTVAIPDLVVPEGAAPSTDSGTPAKYTVKSGDTLYSIARDVLRDPTKWKKVAELNDLAAPYSLKVGQELLLPQ